MLGRIHADLCRCCPTLNLQPLAHLWIAYVSVRLPTSAASKVFPGARITHRVRLKGDRKIGDTIKKMILGEQVEANYLQAKCEEC